MKLLSTDPIVNKYMNLAVSNNVGFDYNGIYVEGMKHLLERLNNVLNVTEYDFQEYLDDIIKMAREGHTDYEIGGHNTKSGNPVLIHFEHYVEYDAELDEVTSETIKF